MKTKYKTKTDKKGNVLRFKCWKEDFKDEDTGEVVSIERNELIKFNGKQVRFYSSSELNRMTKEQREEIRLK